MNTTEKPKPQTVTRIVRGPSSYMYKKPGQEVEVPVEWIGKDPGVEQFTCTPAEYAELTGQPKPVPKIDSKVADRFPGGVVGVAQRLAEAAAAQMSRLTGRDSDAAPEASPVASETSSSTEGDNTP